ncbi:MAG: hypothetical protein ACPGRC_01245 [Salibacteraceae bacterium]
MGTREKLFRQKLANHIESLLTTSEKVFSTERLDKEWLQKMLLETQELTSALTIYQFLHELPENESLQVEFLELKEEDRKEETPEPPSYGEEILKEIDEFETHVSEEVFEVEEIVKEPIPEAKEEVIEENIVEQEEIEIATEEEIPDTPVEELPENEEVIEPIEELPAKEEVKEINDAVAISETSLADKLRSKSIKKLADSIALNERFLYSNELFNGNMEAFKRALNELDHIASKEDAQRYIELQLQVENNWDLEAETVQSFILLVERRFN